MSAENQDTEYISIIIPAYNAEAWLERCLDSVLDAADESCEIIIVDDGSTDSTLQIARRYEDSDARIAVYSEPHRGVGGARKTGVDNSTGDSVIFVDADDVMMPTAIADMRKASGSGADIVIGNVTEEHLDGTKTLRLKGAQRTMTGHEFAALVMESETDGSVLGKKYARHLFDAFFWDTHSTLAGIFAKALLIQLAWAAKGNVVIAPGIHVYRYIRRTHSSSAMLQLRAEGVARLWQHVSRLPIPSDLLARWGLRLLNDTLIQRGIPFNAEYPPAVDLRTMCQDITLEPHYQETLSLLKSDKRRLRHTQAMARDGRLTSPTPHISFIVRAHNNAARVERTVESILDTGFRNIEIILVNDGCNHENAVVLNRMAINYPRVSLVKHPDTRGPAMSRLTGLSNASGYAVMFVEGGDTVHAEGIYDALDHVDRDADITFMGTRIKHNRLSRSVIFDPSRCTPIYEGADAAIESLMSNGAMYQATHGILAKRTYLQEIVKRMPTFGDTREINALWLMSILASNPVISAASAVGVTHYQYGWNMSARVKCGLVVSYASHIIDVLGAYGINDPGRLANVATAVNIEVSRVLAGAISVPLLGYGRARRAAQAFVASQDTQKFYAHTGCRCPSAREFYVKALAHYRRHRLLYTGRLLGIN